MAAGLLAASLLAGAAFASPAQETTPAPEFEAASIKPAAPSVFDRFPASVKLPCYNPDPSRFECHSYSLRDLLLNAYGIADYQLSGPDWMSLAKFDIVAKLPAGAGKSQSQAMLQRLLADRFRVTVHRENREMAGYALTVGPHGFKLKESRGPAKRDPDDPRKGGFQAETEAKIAAGIPVAGLNGWRTSYAEINWLTGMLSRELGKPVVDETGLTGKYDFSLEFSAGQPNPAIESGASPAPSLFQVVQNELGLKLEPRKVSREAMVVDQAERMPTPN